MRLLPRLSDFLLSASPPAVTSLPQSFASLSTKWYNGSRPGRYNWDLVLRPKCFGTMVYVALQRGKLDPKIAASASHSEIPLYPQPASSRSSFFSLTRRHVESSLCCFHLTAAASAAADKAARRIGKGSASACALPTRWHRPSAGCRLAGMLRSNRHPPRVPPPLRFDPNCKALRRVLRFISIYQGRVASAGDNRMPVVKHRRTLLCVFSLGIHRHVGVPLPSI